MIAGIMIDSWKLAIFERRLAGYSYTVNPGLTDDTLLLKVQTNAPVALEAVVRAANKECHEAREA